MLFHDWLKSLNCNYIETIKIVDRLKNQTHPVAAEIILEIKYSAVKEIDLGHGKTGPWNDDYYNIEIGDNSSLKKTSLIAVVDLNGDRFNIEIESIQIAKDGFWIDDQQKYTNGDDSLCWVAPGSVKFVYKTED